MIDRVNFYLQQLVTEADMDGAFDKVEDALKNLALDSQIKQALTTGTPDSTEYGGIVEGLVVTNAGGEAVNVALGSAHDYLGRRIRLPSNATVSLLFAGATLEGDMTGAEGDGASMLTSCPSGQYAIASLFILFDQNIHTDVVDGAETPLKYNYDQSFHFDIVVGAAATPAVLRAPLANNKVLLTDLLLHNNGGVIEVAGVCNSNANWDALAGLSASYANFTGRRSDYIAFDAAADYPRFAVASVSRRYASPRHALSGLVTDLQRSGSTPAGAQLIGARVQAGAVGYGGHQTISLAGTSVDAQLLELLSAINTKLGNAGGIPAPFYDDFVCAPRTGGLVWAPETDSEHWSSIHSTSGSLTVTLEGHAVRLVDTSGAGGYSRLILGYDMSIPRYRSMFTPYSPSRVMAVRFYINDMTDTVFCFGLDNGTCRIEAEMDTVLGTTKAHVLDSAGANEGYSTTSIWTPAPGWNTVVLRTVTDVVASVSLGFDGAPVTAACAPGNFPATGMAFYMEVRSKAGTHDADVTIDTVSIGQMPSPIV